MVSRMLDIIEDKELNTLNQKGLDDLAVLQQVFNINQLMKTSKSDRIKNYFENYYNDLKVVVLRRDFIDLYPKIEGIESDWKTNLPAFNNRNLAISDNQIEAILSSKKNKTVDEFHSSMKEVGKYLSNDTLTNLDKSKVSQNEFVNQKTIYNVIASETLRNNSNLFNLDIMKNYTVGSNDILKTDDVNPIKQWKPTFKNT